MSRPYILSFSLSHCSWLVLPFHKLFQCRRRSFKMVDGRRTDHLHSAYNENQTYNSVQCQYWITNNIVDWKCMVDALSVLYISVDGTEFVQHRDLIRSKLLHMSRCISGFVFAKRIVQFLCYIYPKFQGSSLLL